MKKTKLLFSKLITDINSHLFTKESEEYNNEIADIVIALTKLKIRFEELNKEK